MLLCLHACMLSAYRIARANSSAGKTKPKTVASASPQTNAFAPPRPNNPLAVTWAKGWHRWSHYRKQHGSPHVPDNCKDVELVQWVQEQRVNYALWKQDQSSTFLAKAAWDLLETMGFDFGPESKKRKSKTNNNDSEDRTDASLSVKGSKTIKSLPPKRKREHNDGETKQRSNTKKKQILTLESSSDGLEESDVDSHTEGATASSVEGA